MKQRLPVSKVVVLVVLVGAFCQGVNAQETDTLAPEIIQGPVALGITDLQATIEWVTDETSDSFVRYRVHPDSAAIANNDTAWTDTTLAQQVLDHSVTLTTLSRGTRYEFEVSSTDVSNNTSDTEDGRFTTLGGADIDGPQIIQGPLALGITDMQATIEWVTDEPSDSRVRFHIHDFTDTTEVILPDLVRDHRVTLTNLQAGTRYDFEVNSTDASGNTSATKDDDFTTAGGADVAGPQIIQGPLALGITDMQATIEWVTDEISDSHVRYRVHPDSAAIANNDTLFTEVTLAEQVLGHAVTLTTLSRGTRYEFEVSSTDVSNNTSDTEDGRFTTLGGADIDGPQIIQGPLALGITDMQATIEWVTDEPSDSRVRFHIHDFTDTTEVILPDLVRDHRVTLTNLQAGTRYDFEVNSTDASGNTSATKDDDFTTAGGADVDGPVIIEGPIAVAITDNSGRIEWITDELSDSQVSYHVEGTTDTTAVTLPGLVLEHSVTLTGLLGDQEYEYGISSTDGSGTTSEIESDDFETLASPDTLAPQILTGPIADDIELDRATIEWETDEKSDSRVEFGLDTTYGSVVVESDLDDEHDITLTNLLPDTTYHYRVGSTDPSGNGPTFSGDFVFTTSSEIDDEEPDILTGPIAMGITDIQATIEWTTDEASNSEVRYHIEGATDTVGVTLPDMVLEHRVVLTNLLAGQDYTYEIRSTDASGNTRLEGDFDFTTLAGPDALPPVITEGPTIEVTDGEAIFEWETDEISDSFVFFKLAADTTYEVVGDPELETDHKITLTNLIAGQAYDFYLSSTDPSGNTVTTAPAGVLSKGLGAVRTVAFHDQFQTLAEPDGSAPQILTGPTVITRTDQKVVIRWTTDEPADSYIIYGPDGTPLSEIKADASDVTVHEIALTNLAPGQKYRYQVLSTDFSNNGPTASGIGVVTTNAVRDSLPPTLIGTPEVLFVSSDRVVIGWQTDEASDSFLRYGASTAYGRTYGSALDGTDHVLTLSNLAAGSTYHFQVASVDATGNGPVLSADLSFQTLAMADETPPVITDGPSVLYLADKEAKIAWTTDELGDSYLEYGLDNTYGLSEVVSKDGRDHRLSLTNLSTGATYHYRVASTDPLGNGPTFSADQTFTTAATPDTEAPAIPVNLAGAWVGAEIVLTWQPNTEPDLAGYHIYRKDTIDGAVGSFGLVATRVTDTTYVDAAVTGAVAYTYTITSVDISVNANESALSAAVDILGPTTGVSDGSNLPRKFALHPNYPNPFNPTTTIRFDLPEAVHVDLKIYNLLGQEVVALKNSELQPGYHHLIWNGRDRSGRELATGIYIARLVTPSYTKSIKMVLLK